MFYEMTGKIYEKFDTQQMNENFKKRDFVLESVTNLNGNQFTDFIKFQLTQDRCSYLENFNVNDIVRVNFNIRGRKLERDGNVNYFTHLDAWRIEKLEDLDHKPFDDNVVVPSDLNVPF